MKLTGTDVYMTRGDTEGIVVKVNGYETGPQDYVDFTVRRAVGSAAVLHKRAYFSDGAATIRIESGDTSPLRFGDYVYDVQLTYGNNVKTLITPSTLTLGKEVTYGDNG